MVEKELDGIAAVYPDGVPEEEIAQYVQRGKEKYGSKLKGIEIQLDEDDPTYVCVWYNVEHKPFQRLRRITGYLVGTLDRWNDGKRAEEKDRVKHGVN